MLEKIIEYIKQKYNPLSIILYGSYANGTNNLNSDFDALVISYDHEQFHDTSFVNDIQLDVFVYPASYFDGEFDCNNFIQIFDGKIIAVYKKCYCNIPKKVENMNKKQCECSAGWYMRLFSEVFEKSVIVTIVDTIVNGASECVFEISDYVQTDKFAGLK